MFDHVCSHIYPILKFPQRGWSEFKVKYGWLYPLTIFPIALKFMLLAAKQHGAFLVVLQNHRLCSVENRKSYCILWQHFSIMRNLRPSDAELSDPGHTATIPRKARPLTPKPGLVLSYRCISLSNCHIHPRWWQWREGQNGYLGFSWETLTMPHLTHIGK